MKRIFFSLILLLGVVFALADGGKTDSVNEVLYEQAVKALNNKCFIIRFYSNSKYADYDDRYCFLELDGKKVLYQFYNGRADREPWTGLIHTQTMYQGTASDFSIKNESDGNTRFTTLLKIPYKPKLWYNIVLIKNTNECIVKVNGEGHKPIGYYKGKLYPIGATTVLKGKLVK